ncbi:MAG: Cell surface protein, partial [Myxococcaceae bacterium]|nr:Cell surface protein [Myxococcaceae bacterium]
CAPADAAALADGRVVGGPFATAVVSFAPGEGATFGHAAMPGVVLGPPQGAGDLRGSTDVVSLGRGGQIVVTFDRDIVDGPGDDFVVFENAFTVPGVAERYWEELGEVSVSEDGATWVAFPCDAAGARPHTNCAGWNPVYSAPANGLCALDPRVSGGDAFDLAAVGVRRARYVRVRDLATQGLMEPSTGFDLDAVGVIHGR